MLTMIQNLHTGTSAMFLANGRASRPIAITSEIRQGCPLAPLLFIIAVDVLYDMLEASEAFSVIRLLGAYGATDLKVVGYADDTAIYVDDARAQPAVLAVVKQFSQLSGLRVNIEKSVAFPLSVQAD